MERRVSRHPAQSLSARAQIARSRFCQLTVCTTPGHWNSMCTKGIRVDCGVSGWTPASCHLKQKNVHLYFETYSGQKIAPQHPCTPPRTLITRLDRGRCAGAFPLPDTPSRLARALLLIRRHRYKQCNATAVTPEQSWQACKRHYMIKLCNRPARVASHKRGDGEGYPRTSTWAALEPCQGLEGVGLAPHWRMPTR